MATMKRVNSQSSSNTSCKPSDNGFSHQLWGAFWQHLSSVLFLLISLAAGLGTATAQALTSAYVANDSGTVSVIDTTTNIVVATIPVGIFPSGRGDQHYDGPLLPGPAGRRDGKALSGSHRLWQPDPR